MSRRCLFFIEFFLVGIKGFVFSEGLHVKKLKKLRGVIIKTKYFEICGKLVCDLGFDDIIIT